MVKNYNTSYTVDESHFYRRNNNRAGAPYVITSDRFSSNANSGHKYPRSFMLTSHDPRHGGHDFESDKTRKRIPVACGRCRQRKIKCSGAEGDSQICNACRIAGHDQCAFDRVNSKVCALKESGLQTSEPYPYDMEAGRTFQTRPASQSLTYNSPASSYPHGGTYMQPHLYRSNSFQEPYQKQDWTVNAYSPEYSDENPSFNMAGQAYTAPNDAMSMTTIYGPPAAHRWNSITSKNDSNLYFEPASMPITGYPAPMQYNQPQYSLRSSMPNDNSANFSLNCMANSLPQPPPLPGNDRILPIPSSNPAIRNENALMSLSRTAEAMGYVNHVPVISQDAQVAQSRNPGFTITPFGIPTNASCSPDSSQPDSYTRGTVPAHQQQQQGGMSGVEMYSPPTSADWAAENNSHANEHALRSQNSHGEMSYYAPVPVDPHRKASMSDMANDHAIVEVAGSNDNSSGIGPQHVGTNTPIKDTSNNNNSNSSQNPGLLVHGQTYSVVYSEAEGQELERRGSKAALLLDGRLRDGLGRSLGGNSVESIAHRGSNGSLRG